MAERTGLERAESTTCDAEARSLSCPTDGTSTRNGALQGKPMALSLHDAPSRGDTVTIVTICVDAALKALDEGNTVHARHVLEWFRAQVAARE